MEKLNQYLVQGILTSNITQDGGQQCYQQIPKSYHIASIILFATLNFILIKKFSKHLQNCQQIATPNNLEKTMALVNICSWSITFYYKFVTKKAVFMFNPCHITLIVQTLLLMSKNTAFMQKVHLCWTTWLFGAYLALFFPHLYGLDQLEIIAYYIQHLAIIPLGYIILSRRYGFVKITFLNQIAGFATFAIYQLIVLGPLSIITKANLNFALCHSPADPIYKIFGFHYFSIHNLTLNLASFIFRYLSYFQIQIYKQIKNFMQIRQKVKIEGQ